MNRRLRVTLILVLLAALAGGGYFGYQKYAGKPMEAAKGGGDKADRKKGGKGGGGPAPVAVVAATEQSVPVRLQAIGNVEWSVVEELDDNDRGGGFGHSGR